jgi:hypothetical protein
MASIEIEGIDDDPRTIENVKVYLHGGSLLTSGLETMIAIQTPDDAHVDLMLDLGELVRLSLYTSAMIKLLRGDIKSLGEFDVSITENQISPEWAGLLLKLRS